MKKPSMSGKKKTALYDRIRQILESARTSVARSVNTTQVVANWLIGREIVEGEQNGRLGRRNMDGMDNRRLCLRNCSAEFGSGY